MHKLDMSAYQKTCVATAWEFVKNKFFLSVS